MRNAVFRHNKPQESEPISLIRSLCAYLCKYVDGFCHALSQTNPSMSNGQTLKTIYTENTNAELLFKWLIYKPAHFLGPRKPKFIILDALDELPRSTIGEFLDLMVNELSQLPPWLNLYVTSRDELLIQARVDYDLVHFRHF